MFSRSAYRGSQQAREVLDLAEEKEANGTAMDRCLAVLEYDAPNIMKTAVSYA